jgi:hypothetical protein
LAKVFTGNENGGGPGVRALLLASRGSNKLVTASYRLIELIDMTAICCSDHSRVDPRRIYLDDDLGHPAGRLFFGSAKSYET